MERLLIFLAVLVLVVAGTMVVAMASRGRRPPLRMDSEFHEDDTDMLVGPLRRGRTSPIDRSAQVLDASPASAEDLAADRHSPSRGTASGGGR